MKAYRHKIQYQSISYRRFISVLKLPSPLIKMRLLLIIPLISLMVISTACSDDKYSEMTTAINNLQSQMEQEATISKRLQDLSMNATAEAIVYGMLYPTPIATVPQPTSTFRPPPTPKPVPTKNIAPTPTISPPTPMPTRVPHHTPLSGWITKDTILTKELSPYVLESDINIAKDITLTVRPGVTLKTNWNNITVYGALRLIGNEDLPVIIDARGVYFEPKTDDRKYSLSMRFEPSSTEWSDTSNKGNQISYVLFEDKTIAHINIERTGIKINNCTIPHGNIRPDRSDSLIQENILGAKGSIQVSGGVADIKNNEIEGELRVQLNRKNDFGKYIPHRITNNVVSGRTRLQDSTVLVWGNTFLIHNQQSSYDYEPQVIFDRGQIHSLRIEQNSFIGGTYLNIQNSGSVDINLTDNWWGTVNSRTIETILYDRNDDPSLKTFIFDPYLDGEPGSKGVKSISAPDKPTPTPGPQKCSPSELNAAFSMYGALSKNEVVTVSAWLGQEKLAEKEGLFTSYGLTIPICDSSGHTRVGKELTIKINGVAQKNRLLIQKNVSQKMDY